MAIIENEGLLRIVNGFSERKIRIEWEATNPWLQVTVEPYWGQQASPTNAERKFAVWQLTQDVYDVHEDGSVHDEPVPLHADLKEVR